MQKDLFGLSNKSFYLKWISCVMEVPMIPLQVSKIDLSGKSKEDKMSFENIKTQKAKGILYGINHILDFYRNPMWQHFNMYTHVHIYSKDQIDTLGHYKYFARPCPLIPRHGFVDSRPVKNKADIKKLFDEIKAQDPDGEMILGPYFDKVDYNAVLVNSGMLSIGPNNDGATAGKSSISFLT